MDKSLGSPYPGIDRTIEWICSETDGEAILEASAHEDLFWDLARLKRQRSPKLTPILLVFLYNSIPEIRYTRLKESGRKPEAQATPLAWDSMVNDLCRVAADVAINTAEMTPGKIADIVKLLSDHHQK